MTSIAARKKANRSPLSAQGSVEQSTILLNPPSQLEELVTQVAGSYRTLRYRYEETGLKSICVIEGKAAHILPNPTYPLSPILPSHTCVTQNTDAEKGQCLHAVSSLPRGSLILSERPLYLLPKALERDAEIQAAIVDALPDIHSTFFNLDISSGSDEQDIIQSIYDTNAHSLSIGDLPHSGIFNLSSRISHSCSPNTVHQFNDRKLALELYAIKHVAAGEEITISYYPLDVLLLPRAERMQAIKLHRGFGCACSVCNLDVGQSRHSDARRTEILRVSRSLLEKEIHELEDIEVVKLLLGLHNEEGLVTGRATLYQMAIRICEENDMEAGEAFACAAMDEINIRFGSEGWQAEEIFEYLRKG